jgi:hypothetical protein
MFFSICTDVQCVSLLSRDSINTIIQFKPDTPEHGLVGTRRGCCDASLQVRGFQPDVLVPSQLRENMEYVR